MRRLALVLPLLFLATFAHAAGGRPFPRAQISFSDFQNYLKQVKSKPHVQQFTTDNRPETIAYFSDAERTAYYFTTSGPAYPALTVARLIERDGKLALETSGYYAGSEQAFDEWFSTFRNLGPEIQARLKAKH